MNQQNSEWLVRVGDKQYGPFSPTQLKQLALQGKINSDTLVHKRGTNRWIHAIELKGLFDNNVAAGDQQNVAADQRFRDSDPLEPASSATPGTPSGTSAGMPSSPHPDSAPISPGNTPANPNTSLPANPNPATPVLHNPYIGGLTSQSETAQQTQGQQTQGQQTQGQQTQSKKRRLGINPDNIQQLGNFLFGLAAVFVIGELLGFIVMIATVGMAERVQSAIQSGATAEEATSEMGILSVLGCISLPLLIAHIALLFCIAGVIWMMWKDSKSDRDAKESIVIIACIMIVMVFSIPFVFMCLPVATYPFIGFVSAAAYVGWIIALAILVNRWQNYRQHFVLKNVLWIAGGLALGSFAVNFAIHSLEMVSILDISGVTAHGFILSSTSGLMRIGSICVLGFVCQGLAKKRSR